MVLPEVPGGGLEPAPSFRRKAYLSVRYGLLRTVDPLPLYLAHAMRLPQWGREAWRIFDDTAACAASHDALATVACANEH